MRVGCALAGGQGDWRYGKGKYLMVGKRVVDGVACQFWEVEQIVG